MRKHFPANIFTPLLFGLKWRMLQTHQTRDVSIQPATPAGFVRLGSTNYGTIG
jgi:hypothetical protein